MKINEIFLSIQGEGRQAGAPTTFIRTTGCNLRCKWCDTTYSYEEGNEVSIDEVMAKITELGAKEICLTGGEPLLQPDVDLLLASLVAAGAEVYVETNGTINIGKHFRHENVHYVLDYKLQSSKPLLPFNLNNFKYLIKGDQLKFVVSDRKDYEEAKAVIEIIQDDCEALLLFSPMWEGNTRQNLVKWMLEDKLNIRYSLQIHKVIWDKNKRAV